MSAQGYKRLAIYRRTGIRKVETTPISVYQEYELAEENNE